MEILHGIPSIVCNNTCINNNNSKGLIRNNKKHLYLGAQVY